MVSARYAQPAQYTAFISCVWFWEFSVYCKINFYLSGTQMTTYDYFWYQMAGRRDVICIHMVNGGRVTSFNYIHISAVAAGNTSHEFPKWHRSVSCIGASMVGIARHVGWLVCPFALALPIIRIIPTHFWVCTVCIRWIARYYSTNACENSTKMPLESDASMHWLSYATLEIWFAQWEWL